MADFSTDHSSLKPSNSNTLFFSDFELLNCLSEINNQFCFQDVVNLSYDHPHNLAIPEDKCPTRFAPADEQNNPRPFTNPMIGGFRSESSSGMCSAPTPYLGPGKKQNWGRGKRQRGKDEAGEGDQDRAKEVVHVRAKRGQATDSHSLAERVRRRKINERLRCLQDIVPGCYKTMGMAVMLDEIINYVQSLQNQVEFLSMKLAAASSYYDFNSEADAVEALQRAKAFGKQTNYPIQSLTRAQPQSCSSPRWKS